MNEEYHIQVALVNWIKVNYPDVLFTIAPNGMKLSIGSAVKLKRMGYSRGTPDLILLEPRSSHHGLFIELKTETGRLSPEQKKWQEDLLARDYTAVVCRSFNEATTIIKGYLKQ